MVCYKESLRKPHIWKAWLLADGDVCQWIHLLVTLQGSGLLAGGSWLEKLGNRGVLSKGISFAFMIVESNQILQIVAKKNYWDEENKGLLSEKVCNRISKVSTLKINSC